MTARRIAFLDVDGTILDHGRTVALSTIDAIRGARAVGHLVYLSTGRAATDIHPAVQEIGFDGAITNSGAFATSNGERVLSRPMPRDAVARLEAYFGESGIHYFLQTDDGVYASAEVRALIDDLAERWSRHADALTPPKFTDLSLVDRSDVAKAVFLGEGTGVVEHAQTELGDEFHVVPGSLPLPGGSNGEVSQQGTTKGSAIEAMLEHLGADAADSIGIGDSWNDVEMFQVCGVGIAMGNADAALQAIADEVTTSVSNDGVYNAFVRHGLIEG